MSGGLTVSTGPLVVDPAALEDAAAALADGAARLAALSDDVLAVATDPALVAGAPLAAGSATAVAAGLADLVAGRGGLPVVAARALGLAALLRLAALRYRVGDEVADAVVAAVRRAAAEAAVTAAPVVVGTAAAAVVVDTAYRTAEATLVVVGAAGAAVRTGDLDPARLEAFARAQFAAVPVQVTADVADLARALAAHPGLVQELAASTPTVLDAAADRSLVVAGALAVLAPGALAGAGGDDGVAAAAAALTSLGAVSPLFRETAVVVTPVSTPRAVPSRPPRGIAEVLDGVAHQSTGWRANGAVDGRGSVGGRMSPAAEPGPGVVRLEKVTSPGGAVSWIVEIPGTQTWSPVPTTGTPMDLTTNLRAVAGQSTATGVAVLQAMRAAGVRAGEPVMLAGHSQGGLTAASLAADEAVRAEFTVTHVVTAGSPVDGLVVPGGVQVLSLEHTGDLVPALDGTDAAGSPSRTVVRRDLGEVPEYADRIAQDPLVAHGWNGYIDTAQLVDASADPALVAFRGSAGAFFDAPGATVEAFDYRAERVP